MITLGINAAFHDSAAAIVVDGRIVAASEEERYSRIKHGKRPVPFSAWELPYAAIDHCLASAGIELGDLDHVAYSFDPAAFPGSPLDPHAPISLPVQPSAAARVQPAAGASVEDWSNPWDPLFVAYVLNAPRQLVDGVPHHLRGRWGAARNGAIRWRWHFVNHHLCHQASAFACAPFERCAVLTLDGRGERASTSYGVFRYGGYRPLGEVQVPHSLGILYERVTAHLGFLPSSDEYKVMALAALGQPRYREAFAEAVQVHGDGQFRIAPLDLDALVGPPRRRGATLTQAHFDLAASLQESLEHTVLALARWLREVSGERYLAMAGGVALNCVMNARLRDSGIFDAVWVQPAAGDAGTALGAALWVDGTQRAPSGPRDGVQPLAARPAAEPLADVYLGPAFDEEQIETLLRWSKTPYRRLDAGELTQAVAALLAQDCIVGWFQGRMEFGPRALGARSILASPLKADMQARLNELKDREDFRPVAPVLPQEALPDWFEPAQANGGRSPFMLFVYNVHAELADRIPACCHTDQTARVQTVDAATNPLLHDLLNAFGRMTGVPVLINTSFNVRGEPIVCTPRDALQAFASTPLDALAIGPFLVEKAA